MSTERVQRAWEEHIIRSERGSRVVHYNIRDTVGGSLLAIIGIEQSRRHITYYVTEDFVRVLGSSSNIYAGLKWESRKGAVECLRSVVIGGGPIFSDSDNHTIDTTPLLKNIKTMLTRFSKLGSILNEENTSSRQLQHQDSDIVWLSDPWTCSKQLNHYTTFSWREINIEVHSFVWILNKDIEGSIGYIDDIYDDSKGNKKVKVRYFLFAEEIERQVPKLLPESRELFITPSLHEIEAKSIDGVAAVLNHEHFKKCHVYLPQTLALQTFVSYREYKNGTVCPFNLSNLRGYSRQPILGFVEHYEGVSNMEVNNQVLASEHFVEILEVVSPIEKPRDSNIEVSQQECQTFPRTSDNVEVLCQDSGLRGCWFKCKVVHLCSLGNHLKVQYYDVLDDDGPNKLVERVAIRVASPDRLGMRLNGRFTIRPWPQRDSSEIVFEAGKPVDVWWCDGWWEGVMIEQDQSASPKLKIYLPGENIPLDVDRKDIRISKEWFEDQWVSLEAKPDMLSSIRALLEEQ